MCVCVFLSVNEPFSRLINYGHCVKCVYLQAMQLNFRLVYIIMLD